MSRFFVKEKYRDNVTLPMRVFDSELKHVLEHLLEDCVKADDSHSIVEFYLERLDK